MLRTTLSGQGAVAVGDPDRLIGLTDLEIGFVDGEPVLYAAGRGGSTLSRFSLGDGTGPATLQGSWNIPNQYLQLESTDIAVVTGPGGSTHVLLAGLADDDLRGRVDTGAGLGNGTSFDAGAFDLGRISAIDMAPGGTQAIATLRGGGVVQLEFGANGQVSVSTVSGLGPLGGQQASAVSWVQANGVDYAVVSYAGSDQIALLKAGGNGQMALVDTASATDGAWIDSPGAIATAIGADGASYVIVAAPGSASLTVLEINGNTLVPVDHVVDSLDTRFDDVSHVQVMDIGGQPYVVAAGSDQGLTVFALLPGGMLMEVATMAASVDTPLNGISALEVVVSGDSARIFVATQGAPYLVEFGFAVDNAGATRTGGAGADMLSGTGGDDVISGGAGADTLSGGAGDDVIADGVGLDVISGGAGADTFIFDADGAVDRVLDFQRGTDTLMLRAPQPGLGEDDIVVLSRSWGAEIRVGTEVLHVYSADGASLTWADFAAGGLQLVPNLSTDTDDFVDDAPDMGPEGGSTLGPTQFFTKPDFAVPSRPEPVITVSPGAAQNGSAQNDVLQGGQAGDQIVGNGGNDRIEGNGAQDILLGAGGFDTSSGGAGDDQISGGNNSDHLHGGTGNDVILGGDGFDLIWGDDGADQIWGGEGQCRIWGGEGDDWISGGFNVGYIFDGLYGGAGNDTILGEVGFDHLSGGEGDDLMDGGHQADNLFGDGGNDTLFGNHGFDRLFGGDGNDMLDGGDGPDAVFGGTGDDLMWGGAGDDRFFGGVGNDYVAGEDGVDFLRGNAGFDTLDGGAGDDILAGNFNADRFVFADGHGHDRVLDFDAVNTLEVLDFSGLSGFELTSDVLEAAQQVGADVVITTGADSSITLVNVDLALLDGTDFMF